MHAASQLRATRSETPASQDNSTSTPLNPASQYSLANETQKSEDLLVDLDTPRMKLELASAKRRRDSDDGAQVDKTQVKSEVQWKVVSRGKKRNAARQAKRCPTNATMAAQTKSEQYRSTLDDESPISERAGLSAWTRSPITSLSWFVKAATLHVRGLASRKKQTHLYRIAIYQGLDVIAVQETKVKSVDATESLLQRFTGRHTASVSHALVRSTGCVIFVRGILGATVQNVTSDSSRSVTSGGGVGYMNPKPLPSRQASPTRVSRRQQGLHPEFGLLPDKKKERRRKNHDDQRRHHDQRYQPSRQSATTS
ncbi:hypothetical protein HPB51_020722 [Rhipicephalus microplus]|uniref:Uncharacterized protein n=1 Tax=Rhipicephalus microplus TaxID=6941 RepID=A0A9J6DP29_RHIMP|nr:hypothetical protein HPB51_020722 [Rhipicephalus microplus]